MTPRLEEWVRDGTLYERRGRTDRGGGGTVTLRDPALHPFHELHVGNMPISASATYGSVTEPITAAWLVPKTGETQLNGAVNHRNGWSREVMMSKPTDIISVFTNPNSTAANPILPITLYVPADFVPPLGSNGLTADGATFSIQPNGDGWDIYKPKLVTRGTRTAANPGGTLGQWTSTRWVQHDIRGTVTLRGVSAAGLAYATGLARAWEFAAIAAGTLDMFHHKLALSIPPAAMKATPEPGDGQLKLNSAGKAIAIYPANAQDTQLAGNIYLGEIPMGTIVAIPRDVALESLPEWSTLDLVGKATFRTLQAYGAILTDASSSWAVYAEPSASPTLVGTWNPDTRQGTGMSEAWPLARKYLRQVKNVTSTQPGGGPAPYLAELSAPLA